MALPGVTTVLRDRFYTLSRTDVPAGPRVVAIATRNTADGTGGAADLDPYRITNEADAITAFGYGSGCHRAYLELTSGGAPVVYVVPLPSSTTDTGAGTTSLLGTGAGNVFDQAFDATETALPDIIALWGRGGHPSEWMGVHATPNTIPAFGWTGDNSATATASQLKRIADKVADISYRSHPCFAVVGLKPYVNNSNPSDSMTAAQVATQVTFPNLANKEDTLFGTNGQYVSVVGTEVIPTGYPTDLGYANGVCTYAAQITQMVSYSSPTGKFLFNVSGLRYNPTRTQQSAMIGKGIVPVSVDFERRPVWVDAMTFSQASSDYTRLTTLRIIFDATMMVRQVAQGFVGEAATLSHRNALETAITSGLRGMQQAGALLTSDFVVTYLPRQNKAQIDLVLTPAFEMRTIEVSVAVQL